MQVLLKCFILLLSFTEIFASQLRIESEVLSANLDSYKIIDVRFQKQYNQGHIQGAINFPIALTFENEQQDGSISNPKKMQEILRNLGLDTEDPIVIYDKGYFFDSSRLFWALEVYGFKNVVLLNSSYKLWKDSGYKTSDEEPMINESSYIAAVTHKRLASKLVTQIATKNPNQQLIDARRTDDYQGLVTNTKRFGHIPSATSIPIINNIDTRGNTWHLKKYEELKKVYSKFDKSKKVVIYCSSGQVSSTGYFALRELGFDVANYDGSWKEWSNDFSLPIINLSDK